MERSCVLQAVKIWQEQHISAGMQHFVLEPVLVRIFTPEANRIILQTLLPEAIMTTYEDRDSMLEQLTEAFSWADTVAIGPGLGKSDNSAVLLEQVMKKWNHPMVVDADGLNLLAETYGTSGTA